MSQNAVNGYILFLRQNVHTQLECTEGTEQMCPHEVCQIEVAFRGADEQWTAFLKSRNVLT
ncbi:hypothetical protein D3C76_1628950 [compost metagenome]